MATIAPSSASITRYPKWVWVITGLTAAYATYTIWSALDSPSHPNASGLHRRGAVRQSRRRSPQHRHQDQQLLSSDNSTPTLRSSTLDHSSSPFGTITAQVNDRSGIYPIGPDPPTLQQLENDFALSGSTLRRIHTDMQTVLLDIIVERLAEPNAESFLNSCGPTYSSLLPLVEPIRERNIGDLLSFIPLLAGNGRPDLDVEAQSEWRFDQANVALAFARRCGIDVERSGLGVRSAFEGSLEGLDGDLAETIADSNAGGNAREPGQGIKGLLYTIAEEQAKRSAYIHRGTRCDSCGEFPIRGVRWHCINCPDYDLCSNCEGQNPGVHPRTHVFAKIKIPISTLAQPHQVHDLWYPGDPLRYWSPLKVSLRKRLVSETGFEDVALEALYEQFTCIANVTFPDDPAEIRAAIDRRAFTKAMSSDKWPAPLEPNFLFDRMFTFYDVDNNLLIGFEEFVYGLAYLRQPSGQSTKRKSMDRVLKGYDADGDGLLSRADFVRMFSAKYAIQRHIISDVVAAEEAEIVAHTGDVVRSSQPISAAFTGEDVPYGERREPELKRMDAYGDMQVAVGGPLGNAILTDGEEIWDGPTVNAVARRYDRLGDIVSEGESFRLRHAEDVRSRYNRVESVPLPIDGQNRNAGDRYQRYLVETDSRANRGRETVEPATIRWRTDLDDAIAGGASGSSNNNEGSSEQRTLPATSHSDNATQGDNFPMPNGDSNGHIPTTSDDLDTERPFPDFVLNRGRSYDVPRAEVDFGRDVLFQVVQEGINELLDPLFLEREALAQDVRVTRAERVKWRKEINEFKQAKEALQQQLRTGAEVDPLLATAFMSLQDKQPAANSNQNPEESGTGSEGRAWSRSHGSGSGSESHSGSEPSSTTQDLPHIESLSQLPRQSQDVASEIRSQILRETEVLPTDDDGIEDLEHNIHQQTLDELLQSAGYSIVSPADERPSLAEEWAITRSGAPSPMPIPPTVNGRIPTDPTLPQNRPNNGGTTSSARDVTTPRGHTEEVEEPMRLSPSSPVTPLPPGSPRPTALSSPRIDDFDHDSYEDVEEEDDYNDDAHFSGSPSTARLDYLSRLDDEEKRILIRGGPGRLDFAEVEEICRREGNEMLFGLVESWLEWAGF